LRRALPFAAERETGTACRRGARENRRATRACPRRLPVAEGPAPILLLRLAMKKHRRLPLDPSDRISADLEEVHHLLEGFEQELRKLDEALETLSAYLLRLQSQPLPGRTLH